VRCSICQNVTDRDADPCRICTGKGRDHSVICVVESPVDVLAFEKTAHYKGLYHVLHGVISPLDGIGPDDINIRELLQRLQGEEGGEVKEIVLALNPTVEGEDYFALSFTAYFSARHNGYQKLLGGVPVGAELEFIDEATLSRAMEGPLDFLKLTGGGGNEAPPYN